MLENFAQQRSRIRTLIIRLAMSNDSKFSNRIEDRQTLVFLYNSRSFAHGTGPASDWVFIRSRQDTNEIEGIEKYQKQFGTKNSQSVKNSKNHVLTQRKERSWTRGKLGGTTRQKMIIQGGN